MTHLLLTSTTIDRMISAFSWMLIHSLWQGLLLAVVGGVGLTITRKSTAAYKYGVTLMLFIGFIIACCSTFYSEWNNQSPQIIVPLLGNDIRAGVSSLFSGNADDIKNLFRNFISYFSTNAPMIVMIWFIIFLFKSTKLIGSLVYNQRVRNRHIYEPSEFWVDTVNALSKKLNIKKTVKLLQSGYIKMPVVIGHLKPVILIPAGLIAGLPAEQVEAILLHELAHIRRNDYFVNFLQNITETIFFFNPGLLWISSLLREERENCCDDLALEQSQSKHGFVEALISFKEYELYGSNYATAFPGKKNQLLRRVSRIMDNKNKTFGFGERIFFSVGLFILGITLTTAMFTQLKAASKTVSTHWQYANPYHIRRGKIPGNKVAEPQKMKITVMNTRVKPNRKMRNGISGIHHEEVQTPLLITTPPNTIDLREQEKILSEKDQTEQDRRDETQVKIDQQQAEKDQKQAEKDQVQALKDEIQAKIDQQHAIADHAQAEKDRVKAVSERVKAKNDIVLPVKEKL